MNTLAAVLGAVLALTGVGVLLALPKVSSVGQRGVLRAFAFAQVLVGVLAVVYFGFVRA